MIATSLSVLLGQLQIIENRMKYMERNSQCGPLTPRGRCSTCNRPLDYISKNGCPSPKKEDGSTAAYYELPPAAKELQDVISYLDCNAQMGEIGRAWMRYGKCDHSPKLRDINKIIFYAEEEKKRLLKYEQPSA